MRVLQNRISFFYRNVIAITRYALLLLLLLNSYTSYEQELINANPNHALAVHLDTPVYYYAGDKFYYAPHGELDFITPIWQGKITERFYAGKVLVSPNSKYIMIHHELGLDVIDASGHKIAQLKNVNQGIKRQAGNFWNECFQWSADSKALYLVKDVTFTYLGDRANRSALVKLDLDSGNLTTVYDFTEMSWDFYLGTHNALYYTAYDKPNENWQFKKVDLQSKQITPIFKDEKSRLITTDTIFANVKSERRLYDNQMRITNRNYEECDIYAIGDDGSEKLLFEVQCGSKKFNKGKRLHLQEEINAGVYLSDRFYFCLIYNEQYATLAVDLKTLEYNFYKEQIKPYVASTIETRNLIYIGTALRVK